MALQKVLRKNRRLAEAVELRSGYVDIAYGPLSQADLFEHGDESVASEVREQIEIATKLLTSGAETIDPQQLATAAVRQLLVTLVKGGVEIAVPFRGRAEAEGADEEIELPEPHELPRPDQRPATRVRVRFTVDAVSNDIAFDHQRRLLYRENLDLLVGDTVEAEFQAQRNASFSCLALIRGDVYRRARGGRVEVITAT